MRTVSYGPSESQVGDLYLPAAPRRPVVCLLHGGFWRVPYGRAEFSPVANDLAGRGFTVWNLEYRRLGEAGGGWPGTLQDVAAGIDHLATLVDNGNALDLNHVVVVGHSAGGHLALWSATRSRQLAQIATASRVRTAVAIGLAAVADLGRAYGLSAGNNAVGELLGGSPDQRPERYAAASPMELLPLGVRQLLMHGTADTALPIELGRDYAQAAATAGDAVEFIALPTAGHMDYLDPASAAHATLYRWLERYSDMAFSA
jgi:acetyl esterase/lipase